MKKHSTGALTKEQIEKQNTLYKEKHEYDYIIIGSGNSALTVGSLLAKAGKKICMLEAHDIPGGYAHTFKRGEYSFCAQIHYIWGCGPGGKVYEFLKKLNLEKDITFELYNPDGYDHMIMPDNKRVKIPFGYDKLIENVEKAYPGQKENMKKFCNILTKIKTELSKFPPNNIKLWEYATLWPSFITLLKYKNKTLQNVYDECNLSKEAQAVLCAQAGDFGSPPDELSIFGYVALFGGYNVGAYYPTKHFKYYIDRLAKFITDHKGHIYYQTKVSKININNDKVTSVETEDGKTFTAKNFICNMDPQAASKLIGQEKFPESFKKSLNYKYSPSGIMIYLGLKKGFDPKKYNLGKHNIWHMTQWDMNKMWKEEMEGNFEKPWFFISTPTMHSQYPGTAPKGCHIVEIETFVNYDIFKEEMDKSYGKYVRIKNKIADRLIDLVEQYHIPDLRKHIEVKIVGTPTTNEDFVMAPFGNAYGSTMTPEQIGIGRLKSKTPWNNFFWCNASSGYGGIYGTVNTGMQLYQDLTGDIVFDPKNLPSDEEFIAAIRNTS